MTSPATTPRDAAVFHALADVVAEYYILTDRAPVYADRIHAHASDLAACLPNIDAVNATLRTHVPDPHLGLRHPDPPGAAPRRAAASHPPAGGLTRVQHLDDGVWLVEIHPIFTTREQVLLALQAVAQLTRHATGLILDLRRCFGGDTDSAALIHGWLLGPEPVRLGRFEQRGHPHTDYISDPAVGIHYAGPVRILTSSATFSGGEDIAYVQQALGRASVIGERTRGGAHPVEHFPLPGGHACQIPVARSVIDATGGNWEGVGVIPDTACAADEALERAHHQLVARRPTGAV